MDIVYGPVHIVLVDQGLARPAVVEVHADPAREYPGYHSDPVIQLYLHTLGWISVALPELGQGKYLLHRHDLNELGVPLAVGVLLVYLDLPLLTYLCLQKVLVKALYDLARAHDHRYRVVSGPLVEKVVLFGDLLVGRIDQLTCLLHESIVFYPDEIAFLHRKHLPEYRVSDGGG